MLKYSVAVLSFLAASAVALPASAQGSFDLFAGIFSEDELDVFGLRAGWDLTPVWGVEGSVSRADAGPLVSYSGDVSLRWMPNPERRARFYLLGGPGVIHFELDPEVFGDADQEVTAHLGGGVEIDLTRGFVLRPDLRARWIAGLGSSFQAEATIGLGIRF